LVVALGCTAAVAGPIMPVSASPKPPQPPFTRTIEPADPDNRPTAPPAVDLTAACVRSVDGGQLEAVFGYESHAPQSILVALGPDLSIPDSDHPNLIVRTLDAGPVFLEELGPQVTLFKPGRHRYAFAARFAPQEQVAWQVTLPAEDGSGEWIVSVEPRVGARCGRRVPDHFAVVQSAKLNIPEPGNYSVEAPPFHIVGYEMRQELKFLRVACSAGGEPVTPKVRFGWPVDMNLEPVKVDYRVTVVLSGGTVEYEMTRKSDRPVADILQEVRWLGPIADVTARCAFDDKVVRSDVFWSETAGGGRAIPEIVDGLLVGVGLTQNAPLGTRLR
jgi:hypothetical protein